MRCCNSKEEEVIKLSPVQVGRNGGVVPMSSFVLYVGDPELKPWTVEEDVTLIIILTAGVTVPMGSDSPASPLDGTPGTAFIPRGLSFLICK